MKATEFPNELTQAAFRENDLLARIERLTAENERLTERCAMYKGQVEAGSHEIGRLTAENERLRAALTRCLGMVGHPDNIAFIESALHQQEDP